MLYLGNHLNPHHFLKSGDLVFETGYENTKELANKLKNLNSNIKKYIQNLLEEGIKDDLEALLKSLLQDYQAKIVDRAYYNLTTSCIISSICSKALII